MTDIAVVKIGGALLENPEASVEKIVACRRQHLAIVHGGGIQITRMLERMNVKSQFIDGLRVTDVVALAAVSAALLGEVHTALVSALQHAGVPAVGVFGAVSADLKDGPWGLVGTRVTADQTVLEPLIRSGKVPVIPTLAVGEPGLLNVNGDETAAGVALALRASELIFLTDVEGVLDANGSVIVRVPPEVSLLDASFVTGGMKPKLRAVAAAISGGVS
ncbi:MAG TPA: acetylglutamate kinase, partial [Terriglobia bacterium]|nr:acetylglutamate kinase [Terriglobia bacterium]